MIKANPKRSHGTPAFDKRRAKLAVRVNLLAALAGFPKRRIAEAMGIDPSLLTHMLSGRRNQGLETYIDDIEKIVSHAEAEAKEKGIRLPK